MTHNEPLIIIISLFAVVKNMKKIKRHFYSKRYNVTLDLQWGWLEGFSFNQLPNNLSFN